ncbi:uncharacterized protein ACO6RY_08634 [Pungitius sinensis]
MRENIEHLSIYSCITVAYLRRRTRVFGVNRTGSIVSVDWLCFSSSLWLVTDDQLQAWRPAVHFSLCAPVIKTHLEMSEVLPFNEEKMSHYGNEGDEGHLSFTCRLQDTNNFFNGSQNKRPPKLGQIGRSKRVIEDENGDNEAQKDGTEKTPAEA